MVAAAHDIQVKPGYKHTDIGIIPEDWEVKQLGELGDCVIGLTYHPDNVRSDGLLVLRSSNIADNRLVFSDNVFVDVSVPEKLIVRKGDILICVRNGSRNLIGKCALIDENAAGMTFGAFMSVFRTKRADFVFYMLQSDLVKRQINENIGATINQITNKDLRSFIIPVPKDEREQDLIADTLKDIDSLLASLDDLIAKKRYIKQAAMQQLLTGRTRLPGFSGSWEEKTLGEIVEIINGGTPSTSVAEYWRGDVKWCTPTDITRTHGKYLIETERRISEAGLQHSSATLLPVGTLLLCSRATIGEIKITASVMCTNQGFKSLVCLKDVSNEFLYYLMLTKKPRLIEKAIGSTFLEISKKDTASLLIDLPPLPEQEAIAAILADMDAEISELEQRRDKTQAMKQGMMQELLTGKKRLA